ncbi:Peptidase S8, subtilisin-related [Parasponia andersonii]|uniref:Peptidase S8, subtilisin-related n=1 Tax=Parasponia andersonii TaxID=3476 RepID=A0A2P5ASP0_PARAD|nr:Peptidase S8, subtilisin-related [Parasponia andersonii]
MAPGSLVLAADPPPKEARVAFNDDHRKRNSAFVSGTSFACPRVAAVAALLKSVHPGWSPAAIKCAIMTTADISGNTINPIQDGANNRRQFASPLAMGEGSTNPNQAFYPGLVYDITPQDYVNLLCSSGYDRGQIFAITKSNYNGSDPPSDLNYPSFISTYNNTTSVEKFQRTITNVVEAVSTYKVTVVACRGTIVDVSRNTL